MRILFIRHADPDYINDALTERGEKEAAALAKKLKNEKIDKIYCSPCGRARKTCAYTELARREKAEVLDFLQEFISPIEYPKGVLKYICWDLLPEDFVEEKEYYDRDEWFSAKLFEKTSVGEKYEAVCSEFDELLKKHGYERDGHMYKATSPNRETIALFCHFGVTAALMAHLFSVSPMELWHNFVALPSSVTTVYSEERREGKVMWRAAGFGDLSHLYEENLEPSFSGRFCETFDSDERHD